MSTLGVNDERLIRINNLRRLCSERKLKTADLHRLLPYARYTYWRDVLEGDKPFGEKAARRVEAALGLPDKWLDTPREAMESRNVAALPKVPGNDVYEYEHLVSGGKAHWRKIADLFADLCSERQLEMLPATFLVIVDAGAQLIQEGADKRKVAEALNRLLHVAQHRQGSNKG
jgi:hypothetical protein